MKDVANNAYVPSSVPDGCTPIHLNLVVISVFYVLNYFFCLYGCTSD